MKTWVDRVALTAKFHLNTSQPLVVGVSGGADSLALAHLLGSLGYPIIAVHFDHQLRSNSSEDARLVEEAARVYGWGFKLGSGDVAGHAKSSKLSLEAAARELRYNFLFTEAKKTSAQVVVTAHNADDQVETVLMHLIRGSGLDGMRGMDPIRILPEYSHTIPLFRPFLTVWRREIEAYCLSNGLKYCVDPTNSDPQFLRNRIRLELLPLLETYNPKIKQGINHLASTAGASVALLDRQISEVMPSIGTAHSWGFEIFPSKFIQLPVELRLLVMRRMVKDIYPLNVDLDFGSIQRAVAFIQNASSGEIDLPGGIVLSLQSGRAYLGLKTSQISDKAWLQFDGNLPIQITNPGNLPLPGGWMLSVTESSLIVYEQQKSHRHALQAFIDADRVKMPLTVRSGRPGDRFQPFGLENGSQKLSDYFTNVKLPRAARKLWPLVVSGEDIVWVVGMRPAHFCRITSDTRNILHFQVEKISINE